MILATRTLYRREGGTLNRLRFGVPASAGTATEESWTVGLSTCKGESRRLKAGLQTQAELS